MVELIVNIIQFAITFVASLWAGILFYKKGKQTYFLLTCFYSTFMLGSLHWSLYIALFHYTPQVFYVSELAWTASFVFLLTLALALSTKEERKFFHPAMLLAPAVCIPLMIFFMTLGDIIGSLVMCSITMAAAWLSIRGFVYTRKQDDKRPNLQVFYLVILSIVIIEYSLWIASCFWISDTLTNPYFWIDLLLTFSLFSLLPVTKKVVEV